MVKLRHKTFSDLKLTFESMFRVHCISAHQAAAAAVSTSKAAADLGLRAEGMGCSESCCNLQLVTQVFPQAAFNIKCPDVCLSSIDCCTRTGRPEEAEDEEDAELPAEELALEYAVTQSLEPLCVYGADVL